MTAARVLVVEDEGALARIMQRALLRNFDVEVDLAGDGQLGLEHATSSGYDLIVSDIRMPLLDGISMVERIRGGGGAEPGDAVVLITGHHAEGRGAAQRLGVEFLAKPFSRRGLLDMLRGFLPASA